MSSKIQAIQKDIVHKICSGQVVLNLATAIKELVENSLDANASTVDVRLKEYGSEMIEVIDNGTGIHPDNFQALTLKHHTSKLSDFSDLVNVETFGFRGEALSSLCAVSDMVVITRHASEKCGTKLTFDYLGILQKTEPCPRQVGTTVTLTNLFSSLPVRQKEFQRNLKKEFNKAVQLLSAYCLISTNVKITCSNHTKKGGRLTFLSTQENKTIRDNISCVFGSKQLSNLLEIISKTPSEEILQEFSVKSNVSNSFVLRGYISSCEHGCGRSSTDRQFYFINCRPCEPSKAMKLVNEIYHQYNQHQFPFVVMNIIVPKQTIDVNVTPDKRLIFLQNENLLSATIKSTLISLFENIPSTYKVNNPLSTLPPKSPANSEPQRKISLSALNKWRHANDKSSTESLKRSSQESPEKPVCKQMKLDFFRKKSPSKPSSVPPEPPEVDESESEESAMNSESDTPTSEQNNSVKHSSPVSSNHDMVTESFTESTITPLPEIDNSSAIEAISKSDDSSNKVSSIVSKSPKHPVVADETSICKFIDEIFDIESSNSKESSQKEIINENSSVGEVLCFNSNDDDTQNSPQNELSYSTSEEPSQTSGALEIFHSEPVDDQNRKSVILNTSLDEIRRILSERKTRRNERNAVINKFHAEIDPSKNQLAEEELSKAITKDMFLQMKIIGQFNLGFIISKLENDLFIVDQHATDEKYNFETLQRTTSLKCQKLVVPQNLDLTVTNECVLIDNIEILKKNGFEFSIDLSAETTKRVKLTSIPVSQNWQFGKEDIDEMLFMLQDAPNTLCRPSRIRAMFASRACRKSVMIGTPLSIADMKRLITHMSEIEHPWNCPHGRPTMRHLVNLSLLN